LKTLANLWYLAETADRLTGLFVILADFLARLAGQSIRQKIVDSEICNHALIITICEQKNVLDLRVRMIVLSRSFLGIVDTRRILGRLVFLYKFD